MLLAKSQPNLVGGVSQQPDDLRLESQCRIQENAYGTIEEGLKKRPGTLWLNGLETDPSDDFVGGSYHWVNRDATERYLLGVVSTSGGTSATIRAWDLQGNAIFISDTGGVGPTALINTYVVPSYDSLADFKWTTVNDYTFLVNTSIVPEVDSGNPSPTQDARTAYLYVRQGNYKTNYRVEVSTASTSKTAEVSTWNGTAAGPVQEEWQTTISSSGANGTVWTVTVLGYTKTYTVSGSPTPIQVATSIAAAINSAVGGDSMEDIVTASQPNPGITAVLRIKADVAGVSFTPTVLNSGAGIASTVVITESTGTEYNSIKTDDIAEQLRTQLDGGGWTVTRSGSVLKITNGTANITRIFTSDSVGDTALKGYHLTVDNFDELPPRCLDGTVLQVQGAVEANEDDFYVRFVTPVPNTFGEGEWREAVGPDRPVALKKMPLVLIRKQDDALGTVTTVPFAIYFSLEEYPWLECQTGDIETNPAPSFVGKPITDIFFHKNRFGILTESSVCMSEAGIYGNFFRTTVRQLLDSDVIDIQAAHTEVAKLQHAVPLNERLLVFAEQAQFVVSGDPILTPKTASIQFVTSYPINTAVAPIVVGKNAYFVSDRQEWASLMEYQQIADPSDIAKGSYIAQNISLQIPRYIPQGVTTITACESERVIVVLSSAEPTSLFIYKYFIDGDRVLQAAWSKYTFDRDVLSCQFYGDKLYIMAGLDSASALEVMDFKFGTDDFSTITAPLMDRQISLNSATKTYYPAGNKTFITLPASYNLDAPFVPVITFAIGSYTSPTIETTDPVSGLPFANPTVSLPNNQTATTGMILGSLYTMRYQFGKADLREEATNGGRIPIAEGRYQVKWGTIRYVNTNHFTVDVQIDSETASTMLFSGTLGNSGGNALVKLDQGQYRFPVFARNDEFTVTITNNTPWPSTLIGAEWIAEFTTRFPRAQ
jgi:hypothetical protein